MRKINYLIILFACLLGLQKAHAQENFPILPGSLMADADDNEVLRSWLEEVGPVPSGRLLYRRSTDGANATTFHNLVDGNGPTLVLFKASNGTVFGGFSEASWNSSSSYVGSENAFLFNLSTNSQGKIRYSEYSIFGRNNYGPTFGAGHDIYINSSMDGGYFNNHSYYPVDGSSWRSSTAVKALTGINTTAVYTSFGPGFITEIEVYAVDFNSSAPTVVGQDITVALDEEGKAEITASDINNGSFDPDGIASFTVDRTSFGCDKTGSSKPVEPTYVGIEPQNVHSVGGGFNPITNEFWYPQWSVNVVYKYDEDRNLVSNFNTGQSQMMQLWLDEESASNEEYYTANHGHFTATKRKDNITIWSYNAGYYVRGITTDDQYAYLTIWDRNYIVVLDKNTGAFVKNIYLPGTIRSSAGLVYANGKLYIGGYAVGWSQLPYNDGTIHILDISSGNSAVYEGSFTTGLQTVHGLAFDGEVLWAHQYNNNEVRGYKISQGNAYKATGLNSTNVVLTATDLLGYSASKSYKVTIEDPHAPSITLNGPESITIIEGEDFTDPGATVEDNCGAVIEVTGNVDSYAKGTYTLTYMATDDWGNQSETLERTVVVRPSDTEPPTFDFSPIAITLDPTGTATLEVEDISESITDVSGVASIDLSQQSFTCENVGENIITVTATDDLGNTGSEDLIVIVIDDTSPSVVTQDVEINLDENGQAGITAVQIDNGSTDACGIDSYSLDITSFDCSSIGQNNVVTLTLVDNHGNIGRETAIVTVVDNNVPVIESPEAITSFNDPNLCGASLELDLPVASDNCDIVSLSNNAPDIFPVGETTVIWTALDASGNSSTALQNITITNEIPVIEAISISEEPNLVTSTVEARATYTDNNLSLATWYWGDGTSSEGYIENNVIYSDHRYSAPGLYQVSLKVTDKCDESTTYIHDKYVVVYDPDAGFVTGGGWFTSPADSNTKKSKHKVKANFGFVARYKKNSNTPKGSINFREGNIKFKSTGLQYMVIRNQMAVIKGSGHLKGHGSVSFLTSVVDGDILGFKYDNMRMIIWDEKTEEVFYDNEQGAAINAESLVSIEKGSIVIHQDRSYEATSSIYEAYPNPFIGVVQVNLEVAKAESLNIIAFGKKGNIVFSESRSLMAGENSLRFDLNHYNFKSKDLITLKCMSPSLGSFYIKLVKQ